MRLQIPTTLFAYLHAADIDCTITNAIDFQRRVRTMIPRAPKRSVKEGVFSQQ